ncbi:MAG: hypothetical protein Kow0068_01220 [Marinilabiliales bacterium]
MRIFVILYFFLFSFGIYAQVVNIEKKRFNNSNKTLQGSIGLSLNFTHTTKDVFQVKNNLKLQYYKNRNLWLFFHDLSIMKANSENFINNGFQHIRYNYQFDIKWLVAEAFTQIQYNELQSLQRRFLWGAGGRFILINKENIYLYSGLSIMYEFELLKDDSHSDVIRNSSYVSISFNINESVKFNHITYYQPKIDYFDDYRISSETSLMIKMLKNLDYKVSFNYTYDSKPPTDVQNLFYNLINGISYKF